MKNTIGRNIEILLIYEIKLDDSFPSAQFKIDGFSAPFRFERNNKWGGILMYTREDIHLVSYFANRNVALTLYQEKSI